MQSLAKTKTSTCLRDDFIYYPSTFDGIFHKCQNFTLALGRDGNWGTHDPETNQWNGLIR